jgi:uncharacterized membrane protein HdeD (DUF308 family)
MGVLFFFFFLPLTLLLLVILFVGVTYLSMGFVQIRKSIIDRDKTKLSGGLIAFTLSALCIVVAVYLYKEYVWLW